MNYGNIPAMNELLVTSTVNKLQAQYNRDFIVCSLRQAVDEVREELKIYGEGMDREDIKLRILEKFERIVCTSAKGSLCRVINGTGVVLHTNLGRAPMGQRALEKIVRLGPGYSNLELDLESGERGSRYRHVEDLLNRLSGAEASLIVNNNAAAVLLGLNTLANGREVLVSRGQLIEIGGAFRIPEVMKLSGAKLIEVGTTNKTYLSDFAEAITDNTALIFSAHTSNYKIVGFTQEVGINELAALGKERGLPVMHDLGSGILSSLSEWGLKDEPTIQTCLNSGADLITFSGDKLLGGPQAGIMVGKTKIINTMKKNQLTRALRVDKLTLAALEGTLLEYLVGEPQIEIPVLRMLKVSEEELALKAKSLAEALQAVFTNKSPNTQINTVKVDDMVGGGAYPTYKLPGYAVEIEFTDIELESIAHQLRKSSPAMIVRRQQGKMLISVRTLQAHEEEIIVDLFDHIFDKQIQWSEERDSR